MIDAEDCDAHGYEPVRAGREVIGYVAAGGYGPVVEKSIALAYHSDGVPGAGVPGAWH